MRLARRNPCTSKAERCGDLFWRGLCRGSVGQHPRATTQQASQWGCTLTPPRACALRLALQSSGAEQKDPRKLDDTAAAAVIPKHKLPEFKVRCPGRVSGVPLPAFAADRSQRATPPSIAPHLTLSPSDTAGHWDQAHKKCKAFPCKRVFISGLIEDVDGMHTVVQARDGRVRRGALRRDAV